MFRYIQKNPGYLLAIVLLLATDAASGAHGKKPKQLYKLAVAAESRGDLDAAFTDYAEASRMRPEDIKYKIALERVRFNAAEAHVSRGEKLLASGSAKEAFAEFLKALDIDPGSALAKQDVEKAKELLRQKDITANPKGTVAPNPDRPSPPVRLALEHQDSITLQIAQQSSVLYETIGKAAGINVLVDPDCPSKWVSLQLKEVTPLEALNILSELSGTFWKPVTKNTIYVAQDTPQKRKRLQNEAVQIFYLSNLMQQSDLNDIQTALRNVLASAKMYAVPNQNAIIVKGSPDEILLAKDIIHALDRARPEVLVDVYVLEVKRDKERKLGISPPTSLSVSSGSSSTLNTIGRTSSYSYSIGNATADLLLSDSSTRLLQNPRIRAVDGQKAVLKIGERIPVATGTYTSGTTASSTTSFQYFDVGVNVEMTPTIHDNRDVTMKLVVEISAENGTQTIDSIAEPVIAQQKADQVIRLKEGEVSILAGLIQKQTTGSVSGWPGLGETPALKYLFSTQDHETVDDEIVFMLVPHIVRYIEADPHDGEAIGTGSGEVIHLETPALIQSSPAKQVEEKDKQGSSAK